MRTSYRLRMGSWRLGKALALVLSAVVLNVSLLFSQDRGVPDTVHCRLWELPVFSPDSFGVPVYLVGDDTLRAVSLHFSYSSDHVVLSSISAGSLIGGLSNSLFLPQIRPVERAFTIDWVGWGDFLVAKSGGTLATAYFKATDYSFCSQPLIIDTCLSLFWPSNLLTPRTGVPFVPVFDLPEYIYCVGIGEGIGVANEVSPVLIVSQNYPNPFNAGTSVELTLKVRTRMTIAVFDILGRRVRDLANGDLGPGTHSFSWDGEDSEGTDLASGVYFLRVTAPTEEIVRKIVLLR